MSWDPRWHQQGSRPGRQRGPYQWPQTDHQWHPDNLPPWAQHGWRRYPKRRSMFLRFALGLLVIGGIIAGVTALVSHIAGNVSGDYAPTGYFFWPRTCGLVIILPIIALAILSRIFRSYAVPLADIMDAAEAVAAGNFQVRVKERGSREFKQLANSFNHMTEELARTDQQRRNLTADVAHELRTPLHIIQGNLEGVLDGVYAPTPEHIEATLQETRTLARLVDDLRTLSLAESGQLPLHPEAVDVQDLLADVATSFSPQAESAGIHLDVRADESPMTLYGDPGRLDQVLSNLVGNALRHTPDDGTITLTATPVQNGTGPQIQMTVADTGEGIAADDLPYIFDRFWRGDRARTHKEGTGSGLGLAITAQLVKAHHGTITVTSELGQGTTFVVTLPVNKPPTPPNEATPLSSQITHL